MYPTLSDPGALPGDLLLTIQRALAEDIGAGDATTDSIVQADAQMSGKIIAKQIGVVAGLDVASAVFTAIDPAVRLEASVPEGALVTDRQLLAHIHGPARAVLTGERTALNFLGRMSGIATHTRMYADAVAGTRAVILDTRKTVPGLRALDKLAVRRGGGKNHRAGLYDMILIKDNHIDFAGSLAEAVRRARASRADLPIEVETRSLDDVAAALTLGVPMILLDNMSPVMMAEAVRMAAGRAKLEASGNITLANVRQVAESGVDFISIGALTHSVQVFDVSLLWENN
jgi:nicotinate-nucleotide pyrophosphorylase (carboxylating)